jgi:branched-chain amino acid transport system permease protein
VTAIAATWRARAREVAVGESRQLVAVGGLVAAVALGVVVLPKGVPLGVILLGVTLGALHGLTAMGIVLVYRSSRVINFAQAEIGGVSAAMAVLLVAGNGVPYVVAVPVGLLCALVVGAAVDLTVVRRLSNAPRLIATVAMVGVAQLLGAVQLVLPHLFSDNLRPFTAFKTPFDFSRRVGSILFRGDHVVAVAGAVVIVVCVTWFFGRTRTGIAIRGAAEAPERATLAGIRVRRLSTFTWVISAGLSGFAALLSTPIVGVNIGSIAGPSALVIPLAAAVLAGMDSLPRALIAAIGVTSVQQVVYWSHPRSAVIDVLIFGIVAVGLALQRGSSIREGGDFAGSAASVEPRRLSAEERRHPAIRVIGAALLVVVAGLVLVAIPVFGSTSNIGLAANVVIYCVIVLSALVLTGWSGQVSLGQFALVGVGAATVSALLVETNGDFFLEFLIGGLAAAAVAVGIGAFTRRATGIFLGVATLAAATAFSSYFFNPTIFELWTPSAVGRPELLGRFSIDSPVPFYFFCLAALVVVTLLVVAFRRSYVGRTVLAVRENERAAAANAIHVARTRLFAFGFSGFIAGLAGGLYALSLRGFGYQTFNASESLQVFLLVVIGGLGSVWGALAGAIYGQGVFYFTSGAAELLGTGVGLLVVVLVFPGGFAQVGYGLRDRLVNMFVPRRAPEAADLADTGETAVTAPADATSRDAVPALRWTGVESGYGTIPVLFGASGSVYADDTVAIVGVNGVGKTTLLKTLAGVVPATAGSIELFGEDVTALSPEARVARGLVLVIGGAGVFRLLTVDENLALAAWTRTDGADAVAATRERVQQLFPILEQRKDTRVELLSGGEQQMLTLAMGLMAAPKVLLVDELSLGLAPVVVDRIVAVLNELRRDGLVIVPVEQSLANAARLADRIATMARGRIVSTEQASRAAAPRSLVRGRLTRDSGPHERRADAPFALRVNGVSKSFGGVRAVHDVDLDVPAGQFLGIIGANGAGKTTLLDLLSGFVTPDTGRVEMLGREVTGWGPDRRAEIGLGRVFQHARMFPNLTVRETVAVALSRRAEVREPIAHILRLPAAWRSEQRLFAAVDDVLERLGLGDVRDTPTRDLSTGTRRIVELAGVVANRPELLFLDEPTAGIDEAETEELASVLSDLHRATGATFVMIEHDVELIAHLSERLVCMDHGAVVADGAPEDVLRHDSVLEAYLGPSAHTNGARSNVRTRRRSSASTK